MGSPRLLFRAPDLLNFTEFVDLLAKGIHGAHNERSVRKLDRANINKSRLDFLNDARAANLV